jgi:hypothetical protein
MKLPLLSLAVALVSTLTSCVPIDPSILNPGYGPPQGGSYGGACPPPSYDHDYHGHQPTYPSRNQGYYGGPQEWYKSGRGMGQRDRRAHQSDNYRRHRNDYDGRTESEFAHGYHDGFYGH